jgi:hypothetical protein
MCGACCLTRLGWGWAEEGGLVRKMDSFLVAANCCSRLICPICLCSTAWDVGVGSPHHSGVYKTSAAVVFLSGVQFCGTTSLGGAEAIRFLWLDIQQE